MKEREDFITMPMKDWEEYKARRKELAASHEQRRKELRKAEAINRFWEEAWRDTMNFAKQDMNIGKDMKILLMSMYKLVMVKLLKWSKKNEGDV